MNVTPVTLKDGRTAYRVGGVIVLDPQDAADLLTTGAFRIRCPLTQQSNAAPATSYRMRVVVNEVDPSDRKAVVEVVNNGAVAPYATGDE